MYKFINTRHIRKGAVGEMRHILLVHVKHHTRVTLFGGMVEGRNGGTAWRNGGMTE